ncbi:MAG: hypothetical protein OEV94_11170 [Deltaproteobacteria bacterium]|nr:hypothetical protein [Deltaproteobacteria bacterium]
MPKQTPSKSPRSPKPLSPKGSQKPLASNADERINHLFAGTEQWGARIGFWFSLGALLAYLVGWIPPYIPLETLTHSWGLPVNQYLAATGAPHGWDWLPLALHGDYLALAGVAFLSSVIIFSYLAVIPAYWRKGDRVYLTMVIVQVLVFVLAASHLLTVGGH